MVRCWGGVSPSQDRTGQRGGTHTGPPSHPGGGASGVTFALGRGWRGGDPASPCPHMPGAGRLRLRSPRGWPCHGGGHTHTHDTYPCGGPPVSHPGRRDPLCHRRVGAPGGPGSGGSACAAPPRDVTPCVPWSRDHHGGAWWVMARGGGPRGDTSPPPSGTAACGAGPPRGRAGAAAGPPPGPGSAPPAPCRRGGRCRVEPGGAGAGGGRRTAAAAPRLRGAEPGPGAPWHRQRRGGDGAVGAPLQQPEPGGAMGRGRWGG